MSNEGRHPYGVAASPKDLLQKFYRDEGEGLGGARLWRCLVCEKGWTEGGTFPQRPQHHLPCPVAELEIWALSTIHPQTHTEQEIFQRGFERGLAEVKYGVAPPPSGGWQPIESAPKRTRILIGGGGCPRVHENELRCFGTAGCVFEGLGDKQQPTHWMPLPRPPVEET